MNWRRFGLIQRWQPMTGLGVVGAVFPGAFLALAVIVDLLVPTWYCPFSPPLVVVVPALAAATAGIVGAAAYTCLSAIVSFLMIEVQDAMQMPGGVELPEDLHMGLLYGQLVALAATFAVSLIPGYLRARRERTVKRLRSVSEAVQEAVIAPVPERNGSLRASAEYLAAADEALIGGDLYDILQTPFGTRMIIGDVRGKGLPAVASANNLLGAFRALAPATPTLAELAKRLDEVAHRHKTREAGSPSEEFITATLVSIPDGPQAEVLSCGHPGPLLIKGGAVKQEVANQPWVPLGLGPLPHNEPHVDTISFDVGDTMVLYTDGFTEARDATGSFFPLTDSATTWANSDIAPKQLVEHLVRDVKTHTGGQLNDDAALLVAQRMTLTTPPPDPSDIDQQLTHIAR
jgi:serine phosphatase RsbU (regulator of sigma subunit)